MKTVIWLKTARVYSQNSDGTPKIERTTVKLEAGDNFNKFVRLAHLKGYVQSEPPTVVKVMENISKEWVEVERPEFQQQVDAALKPQTNTAIDYKVEYEKLNARLAALENAQSEPANNEELEQVKAEYKELFGKAPNVNMKLETIKAKIEEKLNA